MVIAIIAGGSGTRLWPLSQPEYPKHLLKLTGQRSLIQNTFKRAQTLTDDIYVITEASHAAEVAAQLPELPADRIVVEPASRGTASCIVLALARIARDHSADEPVVFLHADHHITDTEEFARTVRAAAAASADFERITLIGLTPAYPATGFGYIKSGAEQGQHEGLSVLKAERFEEKPHYELAKRYLAEGSYFWNLGLFAAPISVFERELAAFASDLSAAYHDLKAADEAGVAARYLDLTNQPIDTALIEKVQDLLVVPGGFDWADIGSYFDLHKILAGDEGNSLKGQVLQEDCRDSMIHASTKPIIAIGLEGVIVVDTPEGLLVCSKEKSQRVGELSKWLAKARKAKRA